MTIFLGTIFLSSVQAASASDYEYNFDKNKYYDIFFNSNENVSTILDNVQILSILDIAGKKFLVVQPQGFKLEEAKGYISFDSIAAILPHREFHFRTSTRDLP